MPGSLSDGHEPAPASPPTSSREPDGGLRPESESELRLHRGLWVAVRHVPPHETRQWRPSPLAAESGPGMFDMVIAQDRAVAPGSRLRSPTTEAPHSRPTSR